MAHERAIMLSETLPAGFMAADMADIRPRCGMRLRAVDGDPKHIFWERDALLVSTDFRCVKVQELAGADLMDYSKADILSALRNMTGGRGPDRVIDAVGLQADSTGLRHTFSKLKQTFHLDTDRAFVLQQAMMACRKGGTVSVAGVYNGLINRMSVGVAHTKGLTIRWAAIIRRNIFRL